MEHVEYVYTEGIGEEEIADLLRERDHGVLALADGDESYAVPLNYHYDGSRVLLRVSEKPDSTKTGFAETTETATFVVYDADAEPSWSVVIRGPIQRLPETEQWTATDAVINEEFPAFHLFGEDVESIEMALYEIDPAEVTGRRSVQ